VCESYIEIPCRCLKNEKKNLGSGYLICTTLYVLCVCSFYVHYVMLFAVV